MWKYYQPVTADDHTPACANWASSHRLITFFWLQRRWLKANNILLWCTYLILILGDAVSDSFFTLMPPLSVPLPARCCCVWHVMAICRLAVVKLMTPFFKPQRDDDIFLHDVLQREAVRHFNSPTDPLAAMATVSRSTWTMPALTRGVFLLLVSRWFRTCWITWWECWAWKSQRGFQTMFGTNIVCCRSHGELHRQTVYKWWSSFWSPVLQTRADSVFRPDVTSSRKRYTRTTVTSVNQQVGPL